ncbi:hypothetical protein GCM10018952_17320 [Streptosporangium vulgare]
MVESRRAEGDGGGGGAPGTGRSPGPDVGDGEPAAVLGDEVGDHPAVAGGTDHRFPADPVHPQPLAPPVGAARGSHQGGVGVGRREPARGQQELPERGDQVGEAMTVMAGASGPQLADDAQGGGLGPVQTRHPGRVGRAEQFGLGHRPGTGHPARENPGGGGPEPGRGGRLPGVGAGGEDLDGSGDGGRDGGQVRGGGRARERGRLPAGGRDEACGPVRDRSRPRTRTGFRLRLHLRTRTRAGARPRARVRVPWQVRGQVRRHRQGRVRDRAGAEDGRPVQAAGREQAAAPGRAGVGDHTG